MTSNFEQVYYFCGHTLLLKILETLVDNRIGNLTTDLYIFCSLQGACPPHRPHPPNYNQQGGMFPGPQGPPPRGMGPMGSSFPPNMPPQGHGKSNLTFA